MTTLNFSSYASLLDPSILLSKNILFVYFQKRRREGEREGEKHPLVALGPNWGAGPQLRHGPRQGIKPVTFRFAGGRSIHRATPSRALSILTYLLLYTGIILKINDMETEGARKAGPRILVLMVIMVLLVPTLQGGMRINSHNMGEALNTVTIIIS